MSDQTPKQGWGGLLIPAATFLVGLLIGGLVIGVGRSGGDSSNAAGDPASSSGASGSPSSTTGASASPGETVVTVPAECQKAADKVREATKLLRSTVGDVRNFKPNQIIDALNRLEDLDNQTRPLLHRCSQVEVTTGATLVPSASPSGS
ncbi:MAG: hypothetical protein ABI776_11670 [Nocardioidaceae bacterium]